VRYGDECTLPSRQRGLGSVMSFPSGRKRILANFEGHRTFLCTYKLKYFGGKAEVWRGHGHLPTPCANIELRLFIAFQKLRALYATQQMRRPDCYSAYGLKVECTNGIAWYLVTARMSKGRSSSSGHRNASSVIGMILQPPCSAATISCTQRDLHV